MYNWQDVGLVEIHRATQNRKTDFNIFFNIEPFSSWVPLSQHGTYASEVSAVITVPAPSHAHHPVAHTM